jgi:hypothetical protein
MTNRELANICMELQTAKNWNLNHITVDVKLASTGTKIPTVVMVDALSSYQKAYKTECGAISH